MKHVGHACASGNRVWMSADTGHTSIPLAALACDRGPWELCPFAVSAAFVSSGLRVRPIFLAIAGRAAK
jgi:hypothetical protein